MTATDQPKKLIEVALPLEEINAACYSDKNRKMGMIRNLHKWFAPMPLPAWRALIYAALIDDPADDEKRAYHLDLIKRLVRNGAELPDLETVREANRNIVAQFPNGVPTVLDPFCGGGSTLVEAQRLGLATIGSDLNPVPVLITRALTELLPKVYGRQPLHPEGRTTGAIGQSALFAGGNSTASGYEGLVRDTLFYAERVGEGTWQRVKGSIPIRNDESVVAWLWARTALCPNPTCRIETVLTTSWWLDRMKGRMSWIEPRVDGGRVHLDIVCNVGVGVPPEPPKAKRGAAFICLACGSPIREDEIEAQAASGTLGLRMTAVVTDVSGERRYREPTSADIDAATQVRLEDFDVPDTVPVSDGGTRRRFGLNTQADLYTPRQLLVLGTLADQIAACHAEILDAGGDSEWASAVVTLLGLSLGRVAAANSSQARWRIRTTRHANAAAAFGRNDLPMMWDFAETFFRGESVGDWMDTVESSLTSLRTVAHGEGRAVRQDARTVRASNALVATDPPYFDAISYADLSDYFYVWHRRALRSVHPDLYATVAAPKQGELTAIPLHHGNSREAARDYFVEGFSDTFRNLLGSANPDLPLLVVYASKEQSGAADETSRWSSILTAMMNADLEVTGTWPIHGTGSSRMIGIDSNAVATYVAMVCRPRSVSAGNCSLADFNRALRRELKPAVHSLQAAGILPVDLAQAAMGPGMQVYSRYRAVLDQSGSQVPVDHALRLINAALGEVLDEQEGELDPDSRFAVTWWERYGWEEAAFGEADKLARPQGISVDDVVRAKVAGYPRKGLVRLLGDGDLDRDWTPSRDGRPTAWEAVHHLADRLIDGGGVLAAGRLLGELGLLRDPAQALVYRLHAIAVRKNRTSDQERYNSLIGSWSDMLAASAAQQSNGDGLF